MEAPLSYFMKKVLSNKKLLKEFYKTLNKEHIETIEENKVKFTVLTKEEVEAGRSSAWEYLI
jgi:hypothetical protein